MKPKHSRLVPALGKRYQNLVGQCTVLVRLTVQAAKQCSVSGLEVLFLKKDLPPAVKSEERIKV